MTFAGLAGKRNSASNGSIQDKMVEVLNRPSV